MKHETLDASFRLASPSCPLVFDAYADDFSAGGFYTVNLFFSEANLGSVYGPPAKVRESANLVPSPQFCSWCRLCADRMYTTTTAPRARPEASLLPAFPSVCPGILPHCKHPVILLGKVTVLIF